MNAAAQAGAGGSGAFMGVTRSAIGRRWVERPVDMSAALAISQRLRVGDVVGRLIAARGIPLAAAEAYINPTLRNDLPDPARLVDMDRAAERLACAVRKGERIAIFGDYDVDGATSSALLHRFFSSLGIPPEIYIPDRLTEGYGPNVSAMTALARRGARVIITVDCGTQAHDALAAARAEGADVIVCDHHLPAATLPEAWAIVNPNRPDDTSGQGHLAAVGVAFLLAVAVNRTLRESGWFEKRPAPDLRQWLAIVALGTVADVVPLSGVNRAFVMKGLEQARNGAVAGIEALMEVGHLNAALEPYHLGFVLGPRVNAGGRVGRCDLGARLLSTDDAAAARAIAQELDVLNQERRAIEQTILEEAIALVETDAMIRELPVIVAAREGWHPGVIGIVASRLKERFGKPSIVIAINGGIGKGSGRSVAGVDLGSAIVGAREAGLLLNGGGHVMAAGLTVEAGKVDTLRAWLAAHLAAACQASPEAAELVFDGAISPAGATEELCAMVARCGPYGSGNPEPLFALPSVRVAYAAIVGEQHVRCTLKGLDGSSLGGIAFRAMQGTLGPAILEARGRNLNVAATLKVDEWQGQRRVQAQVRDVSPAG